MRTTGKTTIMRKNKKIYDVWCDFIAQKNVTARSRRLSGHAVQQQVGLNPDSKNTSAARTPGHYQDPINSPLNIFLRLAGAYLDLQTYRTQARRESAPPRPRPTPGARPREGRPQPPTHRTWGRAHEAPPLPAGGADAQAQSLPIVEAAAGPGRVSWGSVLGSPQFLRLRFHNPGPLWLDWPGKERPPPLPRSLAFPILGASRRSPRAAWAWPGWPGVRAAAGGAGEVGRERSRLTLTRVATTQHPSGLLSALILTAHFLFRNLGCFC